MDITVSILQVPWRDPFTGGTGDRPRRLAPAGGPIPAGSELRVRLGRAFQSVWERHLERQVDLRTAAYMVGIARVAEAVRLRGLV
jgi:hypothetical protein